MVCCASSHTRCVVLEGVDDVEVETQRNMRCR